MRAWDASPFVRERGRVSPSKVTCVSSNLSPLSSPLAKGRGEIGENEQPLDFFDLVEPFILAILSQTGNQQTLACDPGGILARRHFLGNDWPVRTSK